MKKIKTTEFDKVFDEGKEDITQYLDQKSARRLGLAVKRVNVDFPSWIIHSLDMEAAERGVTRQSLIKMWLSDRLEQQKV